MTMFQNISYWLTIYGLSSLISQTGYMDQGMLFAILYTVVMFIYSVYPSKLNARNAIFAIIFVFAVWLLSWVCAMVFKTEYSAAFQILTVGYAFSMVPIKSWQNKKKVKLY